MAQATAPAPVRVRNRLARRHRVVRAAVGNARPRVAPDGPDADNDVTVSTADQIIATFDILSARIGLVSVGFAAVSLLIGGIRSANVMFISVTDPRDRTAPRRRRAAPPGAAAGPLEAAFLATMGGAAGVMVALAAAQC